MNAKNTQTTFKSRSKEFGTTTIIVPCYNEENRIDAETFIDFVSDYESLKFLFVDDGSRDGTLGVLARMRARAPHAIDVLALPENVGKAEAVRHGLIHASEKDSQLIGFLDADLATPLEAINDMIRVMVLLDDVQVVMGSRTITLGHRVSRAPVRKMISLVCAALARLAIGIPVRDTQCGAKLFRNTPSLRNALAEPFEAGWLFDVELLLRIAATQTGAHRGFYEHPLMAWTEVPGSKVSTKAILRSGLVMLGLIVRRWQIRTHFRRKIDLHEPRSVYLLSAHDRFDLADLQAFGEKVLASDQAVTLDLSRVQVFGPMVMPAILGLADAVRLQGRHFFICLPDDDECCEQARRAGLTALVDCTRVRIVRARKAPEVPAPKAQMSLAEVA